MAAVNLLFPHQLFRENPLVENGFPFYLVEEHLFFRQYAFHKQKIAFHRATMRFYADHLRDQGIELHYIDASNPLADIRNLIEETSIEADMDPELGFDSIDEQDSDLVDFQL